MKKQLFLSLMLGVLGVILITGCSFKSNNSTKVKKIDGPINYFEIKNKKIYLTEDLEDFVLQFKGLGCNLSAQYHLNGSIEIDDINSKDSELYTLESGGVGHEIKVNCPGEDYFDAIEVTLFFKSINGSNDGLFIDRPINYWSLFSLRKNVIVGGNKGTLIVGSEPKRNDIKDIEKLFGKNYKSTTDEYGRLDDIEIHNKDDHYSYSMSMSYSSRKEAKNPYINSFIVQ